MNSEIQKLEKDLLSTIPKVHGLKYDSQFRKCLVTINNPDKYGYDQKYIETSLQSIASLTYYCFAREKSTANQTPHIHIAIFFSSPVRFSRLLKLFPHVSDISRCKGTPQQICDYVKKEGRWKDTEKETTNDKASFREYGILPQNQPTVRKDLDVLYELITEGKSTGEIIHQSPSYIRYINHIERTRTAYMQDKYKNEFRTISCTYIYGATGTGKTRGVMESYDTYSKICRITNYAHPFDSYRHEQILIFEEYRSSLPISDMLIYLEGYPNSSLPSRYNDKVAIYTDVYIISNIPLEEQYKNVQRESPETWKAFLRRINKVIHYRSTNDVITYHSVEDYMHQRKDFQPCDTATPFHNNMTT